MIAIASRFSPIPTAPMTTVRCARGSIRAFDRFVDIQSLSHREAARAHSCGQGRYPDRPQGLYPSGAAGDISLSPGAGAGELSRLSRHHGGGFHRLHHRRPLRRSRAASSLSFRKSWCIFPAAIRSTTESVRWQALARRGRIGDCRKQGWCFAASTTVTRSRRRCSISGCACCARFPAAYCGCSRRTSWSKAIFVRKPKNAAWRPDG